MFQGAPPGCLHQHPHVESGGRGRSKAKRWEELPPPRPSAHTTQAPGVREMELQNCGVTQQTRSIEESRDLALFKDLKSRSTPSP